MCLHLPAGIIFISKHIEDAILVRLLRHIQRLEASVVASLLLIVFWLYSDPWHASSLKQVSELVGIACDHDAQLIL